VKTSWPMPHTIGWKKRLSV